MTLIENKVLLLNSDYRVLRFVRWSRALKLVFRDKVEILSEWDKKISSYESTHNIPAIIRLKSRVKYFPTQVKFTKLLVRKRDDYTCQYCGKSPTKKNLTIDHVIPKSRGGKTDYQNCVVACYRCNNRKNNKTPSECGYKLLRKPKAPPLSIYFGLAAGTKRHSSWETFLNF